MIQMYKGKIEKVKKELEIQPNGWQNAQKDIDSILDEVFDWLSNFEKNNESNESKVYEMKHLFIQHCRDLIRLGKYNRHVIDKPYGYHGDFMIIDEIYKNSPNTTGIERCMDNYFLKASASVATRNRKEDFKQFLMDFSKENALKRKIRILDLASGPCTDIIEFYDQAKELGGNVLMDCLDHDINAIEHSKSKLKTKTFNKQICFLQKNVIKLALTKNIEGYFSEKYHLIFSTGLFDYLDEKISTRLVANLKKLLVPNGLLIISNYRDKWSNPARHFMEWGGDWELVYRTEQEFLKIFESAGFISSSLNLKYEPLKIMQYCFARN